MTAWLPTWTRAVVTPAWRRASAVWIGTGIPAGVIFGPTGMHPHDLTQLALGLPALGIGLALTWLLVFVPTARALVRPAAAGYLRALPHPRAAPPLIAALALVVLQLPWLALWLAGDGSRGLALVLAWSLVIAGVASVQLRPRRAPFPPWTRPFPALRGVYVRALARRAGDTLVRGIGIALLAGLAAGLVVRNNGLVDADAAPLGAGVISVLLVPACAGALLPLSVAQRESTWLASSLGMSSALRVGVLASVVAGVYVVGTLFALAGFVWLARGSATLGWLAAIALPCALGTSLVATRALVIADRDARSAAVRVVTGAIVASAMVVVALGWLGAIGAPIVLGAGIVAVMTARLP